MEHQSSDDNSGIRWLEAKDNPWGVPDLDVRPITLNVVATSSDPIEARNSVSFAGNDGTSFIGMEPAEARTIPVGLKYPLDQALADGVLFTPSDMDQKWAIYLHRGQILFVRSWQRRVVAVAQVEVHSDSVEVTQVRGAMVAAEEEPSFTVRVLDYLLRSHALGIVGKINWVKASGCDRLRAPRVVLCPVAV